MSFSEDIVWQVWSKAYVTTVSDAPVWRKDECGAWIQRTQYGNRNSQYGWEIDHIMPKSEGGTDDIFQFTTPRVGKQHTQTRWYP